MVKYLLEVSSALTVGVILFLLLLISIYMLITIFYINLSLGKHKRLIAWSKKILNGREFSLIDRLIVYISLGKSSGWVMGNRLRAFFHGKSEGTSEVPVVFIGCYPRSGSTLLMAMLQQHSKIIAAQTEINVFQDIKNSDRDSQMNIQDAFKATEEEIDYARLETNTIKVADKILRRYKGDNKYVLLKQPKNIFFVDKIFKHFPKSKFIHITRDGKDATMSQRYYCLPPGKTEHNYDWCCRQWNVCMNIAKGFKNNPNYLEVKYEDLVKEPRRELISIFQFLGMQYEEQILENYKDNFDLSKIPSHKEVLNPLKVKKWDLSKEDKKIFELMKGGISK